MKADYTKADIPAKDIEMLDFAVKLTTDACALKRGDAERLQTAGFRDADILDIVQVIAYFNYVNRMACGLGVELEDYWEDEDKSG